MADQQSHYDILGVEPTAERVEITRAFRKLASLYHPDRGTFANVDPVQAQAKMAAINLAYEVLKDDKRRAYYDRTGRDREPMPLEDKAHGLLADFFTQYFEKAPIDDDPIVVIRQRIQEGMPKYQDLANKLKQQLVMLTKKRSRLRRRTAVKEDLFTKIADEKIAKTRTDMEKMEEQIQVGHAALELLEQWETQEPEQTREVRRL